MKKLREILKGVKIVNMTGNQDVEIENITSDSREVSKNTLFFAINGFTEKGIKYLDSAVEKGAVAAIVEEEVNIGEYDYGDMPIISVKNARRELSRIASNYYDNPSKDMVIIGVTGTKGKSTTTFMTKQILREVGYNVALLGSIGGYYNEEKILNNTRTTPESFEIQKFMYDVKKKGATHVVLEVSSQAMITNRVEEVDLDIVAFTNFSEDHVSKNEHPTIEDYYEAKLDVLRAGDLAVINWDDEMVRKSMEKLTDKRIADFGIISKKDIENDEHLPSVYVKEETIQMQETGTKFHMVAKDIEGRETDFDVELKLPGKFNIYNAGIAVAIAKMMLVDDLSIQNGLNKTKVLGRLEPVPNKLGLNILLDYAHTPSSLENVLQTVKNYAKGRVICAWGVGGDRDKVKRPIMGEISGRLADYTILMSDQVRTEDPENILRDIEKGLKPVTDKYEIIIDRKEGIERAIRIAEKEDTILIPGFGHDMYQEINGIKHHFDEREVIAEIVEKILREKNK